jgi:hypothetical protein
MKDLLDAEGIENGQTPEEACKSRIYNRAFRSGNTSVLESPEYRHLEKYFWGELESSLDQR